MIMSGRSVVDGIDPCHVGEASLNLTIHTLFSEHCISYSKNKYQYYVSKTTMRP